MTGTLHAQAAATTSFQGYFSDASGVAVSDGDHEIVFKLYSQQDGGDALWSETLLGTCQNGVCFAVLGSSVPLSEVDLDQSLWLGVAIDGGPETLPRTFLSPSPLALVMACPAPAFVCTENCDELIQFDPSLGLGYEDYPINGETSEHQYRSWLRREGVFAVKHVAARVACLAEAWPGNGGPIGLGDMSEQDGSIPGTSTGSPGHPPGTHEDGLDIDIAYFQRGTTDNHLRPICPNDGFRCTAPPDKLDASRTALLISGLAAHPGIRVIGVDHMVGPPIERALDALQSQGLIDNAMQAKSSLAYDFGTWSFRYHSMYVSFSAP